MADNVKGISVEIRGNTTGLTKALGEVNKQTNIMQTELKQVERLLKLDPTNTQLLAQKQALLANNVETTKNKLDALKKAQQSADSEMSKGSEVNQNQYRKLQREIVATEQTLKTLEIQNNKFVQSIKTSGENLTKFGTNAMDIGKKLAIGVTVPLVGVGVASVKVGMDFESAMSRVKAISGATGDSFKLLNDMALQLGKDTAFSAKEAAQGMENLASAGFNVDEIMKAMPGMLDLAASGGLDIATASDIAASALRGFGLDADKSGHVADVLAKVAADTNANVTDMGMALKYAAPPAHALGMSIEEVSAAIGIMSNSGIKGEQAGTTLRGSLISLASPSDAAAKAMSNIGFNAFDAHGKMLPFKDVVELLTKSTKKLTDEKKADALATIFGKEALSGMMTLVDAGSGKLDELTKSFKKSDGSAKEMATTMQDNAKSSIEQMIGSLETAAIKIEQNIAPTIRQIALQIQEWANSFSNLSPAVQQTIIVVALVVAAVAPLLILIGAMASGVGALITGIGAMVLVIKSWELATIAQSVAQLILTATMNANGITKLIMVIAAIVAAMITYTNVTKNLTDGQDSLNSKLEESAMTYEKAKQSIDDHANSEMANADKVMILKDKLYDLDSQVKSGTLLTDDATQKKKEMNAIVNQLNSSIPNLKLQINGETGEWNLQRQEIDKLTTSFYNMVKAKAMSKAYQEKVDLAAKRIADAQITLDSEDKKSNGEITRTNNGTPVFYSTGQGNEIVKANKEIISSATAEIDGYIAKIAEYSTDTTKVVKDETTKQVVAVARGTDEKTKKVKDGASEQAKIEKEQTKLAEEARDKEFTDLKFSLDMGEKTQEQYYDTLGILRDKYFVQGSTEWQKYTLEIVNYQKQQVEKTKKDVFDTITELTENISLKFQNWIKGTGKNASETEKLNKEVDSLNDTMKIQQEKVDIAKTAYQKMVDVYGAQHLMSLQAENDMLTEIGTMSDLINKVDELKAKTKSYLPDSIGVTNSLAELKKAQKNATYLAQAGYTTDQQKQYIDTTMASGGQNINVENNYYVPTATPSVVAATQKKSMMELTLQGAL